jgi:hypothetical protein
MASLGSVEVRIDKELIDIIDQLREEVDRTRDWYAVRWRRLRDLIHENALHIENEACSIMANGTATPNEPPSYAIILNARDAELTRLRRFELAMERMAAQYIDPKTTASEMADEILKAKQL